MTDGVGQHVVLLMFKQSVAGVGGGFCEGGTVLGRFASPCASLVFPTFEAAAEYERTMQGCMLDLCGWPVEVIYERRKAGLPPDVRRRGAAMSKLHVEFENLLKYEETLKQGKP